MPRRFAGEAKKGTALAILAGGMGGRGMGMDMSVRSVLRGDEGLIRTVVEDYSLGGKETAEDATGQLRAHLVERKGEEIRMYSINY